MYFENSYLQVMIIGYAIGRTPDLSKGLLDEVKQRL